MRSFIKVLIVTLVLGTLFCCNHKETVFLEKDGQKYEVANHIAFYYPKEFVMNTTGTNQEVIQFVHENELISYQMVKNDVDNPLEQMPALYAGQLEEDGAIQVGYKNIELESGLNCQEFTGVYQSTGIKFKHMVYFTTKSTYILSYQSPQNIYDEEISLISQYLDSLVVHEE